MDRSDERNKCKQWRSNRMMDDCEIIQLKWPFSVYKIIQLDSGVWSWFSIQLDQHISVLVGIWNSNLTSNKIDIARQFHSNIMPSGWRSFRFQAIAWSFASNTSGRRNPPVFSSTRIDSWKRWKMLIDRIHEYVWHPVMESMRSPINKSCLAWKLAKFTHMFLNGRVNQTNWFRHFQFSIHQANARRNAVYDFKIWNWVYNTWNLSYS